MSTRRPRFWWAIQLGTVSLTAALLVACGATLGPTRSSSDGGPAANPTGPPVESGMVVGREYPYSLYVHCGATATQIDGRTFYVDSPTGVRSTFFSDYAGHPSVSGTMTLVSNDDAVFHADSGVLVHFIDHNPVVVGKAYTIEVWAGGPDHLESTSFAGGVFAPGEILSGRLRLPGAATTVSGRMILDNPDNARFSVGDAVVAYHRLSGVMCA